MCALAFIILTRLRFKIWIPGFDGGGFRQFFITLTNAGLLPDRNYLSQNLLRLIALNTYANAALTTETVSFLNLAAHSVTRRALWEKHP
ncbi:MAG: hypothetical protein LBS62_05180 [Clostridiales bacterium]|nr:hypothetical protein [Clostridiales bacterium]